MRFLRVILPLLILSVSYTASSQEEKTITNLNASGGKIYFNLASGKEVSAEKAHTSDWDLSFAKTTIGLNEKGKVMAQVVNSTYEDLKKAPAKGYRQDTEESSAIPTGSGNGWYNYNMEDHTIVPIADRSIVVKAVDGKKYKIRILSYNKDQKSFENTGYYSFQYTVVN